MSEILKPTPEQLAAILADHAKYRRGEGGGKRADLSSADLSGANRLIECAPGIHFYLTREEAAAH